MLEDTAMMHHALRLLVTLALFVAPLVATAQLSAAVPRIGFLLLGSPTPDSPFFKVFRQSLHELGYVEGQNVIFEYRWAGTADQFPDLAADLVRLNVDAIVAPATPAIHAAKDATTTIPIVILSVGDPVRSGFVESLARPGGNITGVTGPLTAQFSAKLLELLKEAVPKVARMAVRGSPATMAFHSREVEIAARSLGIQLQFLMVQGANEFESAFETATRQGAGALIILPTVFFSLNESKIAALAVKHQLPAIFWRNSFAEVGGLMAYGPSRHEQWQRAAALVGKILKGAKPSGLPVEQATTFELVINLKTAQALGLTIPPTLLFQADELIR
jgi:putative tryptophan/tyrosine transport system substrate-binding protein